MDLVKIGEFILKLRKEKGLTQKDLGELVNVTDKAVSKWERGCNLPDCSTMAKLCGVLGITVNELLAGEKLASTTKINEKAEENIIMLMEENNKKDRIQRIGIVFLCIVIVVCLVAVTMRAFQYKFGIREFFDPIGLLFDILIPLLMLVFTKRISAFLKLFSYNSSKLYDLNEVRNAGSLAIKGTLIGGGISGMFWLINWLSDLSNAYYFGPNIANIFMGFFYSLIISAIILCLKERL